MEYNILIQLLTYLLDLLDCDRNVATFNPANQTMSETARLYTVDSMISGGLLRNEFWKLFSRCEVCHNFMTTRTIDSHVCLGSGNFFLLEWHVFLIPIYRCLPNRLSSGFCTSNLFSITSWCRCSWFCRRRFQSHLWSDLLCLPGMLCSYDAKGSRIPQVWRRWWRVALLLTTGLLLYTLVVFQYTVILMYWNFLRFVITACDIYYLLRNLVYRASWRNQPHSMQVQMSKEPDVVRTASNQHSWFAWKVGCNFERLRTGILKVIVLE